MNKVADKARDSYEPSADNVAEKSYGQSSETVPLTAADVVSAMTQVLRAQQPATAEPPIEPAGWSPFAVAALRGGLTALLVGVAAGLAAWTTTDSLKLILLPALTAAVGVLYARFVTEGGIDQARFERTRR